MPPGYVAARTRLAVTGSPRMERTARARRCARSGSPATSARGCAQAMAEADVLAVEDTRRLHRLAADLEVTLTGRVVTFHESVERARLPGLVAAMADGATVLLLTDAGMPSVSDPGYTLVRAAIEAGIDGHRGARARRR